MKKLPCPDEGSSFFVGRPPASLPFECLIDLQTAVFSRSISAITPQAPAGFNQDFFRIFPHLIRRHLGGFIVIVFALFF
jgi:hypothetical protein